jgi:hypothetical protein
MQTMISTGSVLTLFYWVCGECGFLSAVTAAAKKLGAAMRKPTIMRIADSVGAVHPTGRGSSGQVTHGWNTPSKNIASPTITPAIPKRSMRLGDQFFMVDLSDFQQCIPL